MKPRKTDKMCVRIGKAAKGELALSPEDAQTILQHAAGCPECADRLGHNEQVLERILEAAHASSPEPSDFDLAAAGEQAAYVAIAARVLQSLSDELISALGEPLDWEEEVQFAALAKLNPSRWPAFSSANLRVALAIMRVTSVLRSLLSHEQATGNLSRDGLSVGRDLIPSEFFIKHIAEVMELPSAMASHLWDSLLEFLRSGPIDADFGLRFEPLGGNDCLVSFESGLEEDIAEDGTVESRAVILRGDDLPNSLGRRRDGADELFTDEYHMGEFSSLEAIASITDGHGMIEKNELIAQLEALWGSTAAARRGVRLSIDRTVPVGRFVVRGRPEIFHSFLGFVGSMSSRGSTLHVRFERGERDTGSLWVRALETDLTRFDYDALSDLVRDLWVDHANNGIEMVFPLKIAYEHTVELTRAGEVDW